MSRRIDHPVSVHTLTPVRADPPASLQTRAVVRFALLLTAAAVSVQTICQLINGLVLHGRYRGLDADADGTSFTWASTVATFSLAVAAMAIGRLDRSRARPLTVLAALAAFFSLDDVAQIHEQLAEVGTTALGLSGFSQAGRLVWPVLYLPLFAVTVIVVGRYLVRLALPRTRFLAWTGLGMLALAVVAEAIAAVLVRSGYGYGSGPYVIEVAFEEGLELAGWALIATAALAELTRALRGDPSRSREQPRPRPERDEPTAARSDRTALASGRSR